MRFTRADGLQFIALFRMVFRFLVKKGCMAYFISQWFADFAPNVICENYDKTEDNIHWAFHSHKILKILCQNPIVLKESIKNPSRTLALKNLLRMSETPLDKAH